MTRVAKSLCIGCGYAHVSVLVACLAGCQGASAPGTGQAQGNAPRAAPPALADAEVERLLALADPQRADLTSPLTPPSQVPEFPAEPPAPPADSPSASDQPPVDPPAAAEDATDSANEPAAPAGNDPAAKQANPFPPNRPQVPEFSKELTWLNSRPLTMKDLKGKFVLLDFWTYCCINCMHILPELKKLEQEFPNNLVVIGVHSAKFETEKMTDNIREAILRYEVVHPVVNDANHELWDTYGVSSWPTIVLIDPEGKFAGRNPGEFKAELVRTVLSAAIPYYRAQKLLDEKPLRFELEAFKEQQTPLRFPGKILADEKGNRLFISDSNHNRIVVATFDGKLLDVIGSGAIGKGDGDYQWATFNHPQGCALAGETLYVADTENHLLRKVDLQKRTVTTIAGTGAQGGPTDAFPGWDGNPIRGQHKRWVGPPARSPLSSPWALAIHKTDLFIAMAGYHQIWKMPLDEREIGPFAGNGREDIVDKEKLPADPYRVGSSFAQPSGLSSDGTWLYVADSEGSSIRAVPFEGATRPVKTVIGSSHLELNRLFTFGDKDGTKGTARLQHCLEVVHLNGKLYVADTYNHKIKIVDAKSGDVKTLAGTGKPGTSDEPAEFHEPAGLAHAGGKLYVADTNNHLIRTIDLSTGKVTTLTIEGLAAPGSREGPLLAGGGGGDGSPPPAAEAQLKKPSFQGAHEEKVAAANVKPINGVVTLQVSLKVPAGWKLNPLAPMSYWLDSPRASGPADRAAFGRTRLEPPTAEFEVPLRVSGTGDDEVQVSLNYNYCQAGDNGVCKFGAVVFTVPFKVAPDGNAGPVKLAHTIPE